MKMRVQLEVVLDVNKELLKDNGEDMSNEQIASSIYVAVPRGSLLSCMDEAIDIESQTMQGFKCLAHKKES